MAFDGLPGGAELRAHGRLRVFDSSLGPIAVTKKCGVAFQNAKYDIKPAGIKGYAKTRMQNRKISKIKAAILSHSNRGSRTQDRGDASQSGGPSTEWPAD